MTKEMKLLKAAMAGNTVAFEQIVKKYQSLVCAITFSGTGRLDISEELAQETFLSAWKNLRQLTDPSGFRPWLCTIARNMLNRYYRKKKTIPLDPAHLADLSDQNPTPSDNLITQEEHIMLEQALMRIPTKYREPLVLYYRQQKSIREVAICLELNESAVQTRLHRARKMLQEEIAARLERTLERTAPDKTFTKAVMIAVGGTVVGMSASASAATASTAGTGTSTGIAAVMSTVTAKVITAVAVVAITVGGVFTYKHLSQPEPQLTQSDEVAEVQQLHETIPIPDESAKSDSREQQETAIHQNELAEIQTATVTPDFQIENTSQIEIATMPSNANLANAADIDGGNQLSDNTESVPFVDEGYSIVGTVKDEAGNPLEGVQVQLKDWWFYNVDPKTQTETDENGTFQLNNLQVPIKKSVYEINAENIKVPVEYPMEYVSATADGFAPQTIQLFFRDEQMRVDFILNEGQPIYGRVVDTEGNPLEGAAIRADEMPEFSISPVEWETKTDAQGRFTWLHAPKRSIKLALSKDGFMSQITNPVIPSGSQYEFIMNIPIRVSGQVIDAVTKEPVTVFTLERSASIQSTVSRVSAKKFENVKGYFRTEFPWQGQRYSITAKADGHKTTSSRLISMDEQDVELLIEMKPETGVDGIIVDPNGQPLEGVRVIIPKSVLQTEKMRYDVSKLRYDYHTLTDAEGRFHLEPTDAGASSIIVLEDNGYINVPLTEFTNGEHLVLQPYAKIIGDYYKGAKPVPNAPLRINYLTTKSRNISNDYTVQTDEQGKFEFDRLMAGTYRFFVGPFKRFHLKPGEVKEVYLGGGGLTVTGQLLRPDGKPMTHDWGYNSSPRLRRSTEKIWPIPLHEWPLPENADAMSYCDLVEWWGTFLSDETGDTWFEQMQQQYGKISSNHSVRIGNDGRFTVPDVEAGTYLLETTVYARKDPNDPSSGADDDHRLARIAEVVVVPELDEVEDIKTPIDIGQVQCLPSPLAAGMVAPDFDIEKLHTSGRLRLSDYQGKPLLMNFTNPYMDQSNPEAAAIQQKICEQLAAQQDTAVVNVAMEQFAWEYLRSKLKAESNLPGTWGVTQWFISKLYIEYELGRQPESVLIDADGTILWKGIPSEDLLKELETLVRLGEEN